MSRNIFLTGDAGVPAEMPRRRGPHHATPRDPSIECRGPHQDQRLLPQLEQDLLRFRSAHVGRQPPVPDPARRTTLGDARGSMVRGQPGAVASDLGYARVRQQRIPRAGAPASPQRPLRHRPARRSRVYLSGRADLAHPPRTPAYADHPFAGGPADHVDPVRPAPYRRISRVKWRATPTTESWRTVLRSMAYSRRRQRGRALRA
jgi:hypothetical protein